MRCTSDYASNDISWAITRRFGASPRQLDPPLIVLIVAVNLVLQNGMRTYACAPVSVTKPGAQAAALYPCRLDSHRSAVRLRTLVIASGSTVDYI